MENNDFVMACSSAETESKQCLGVFYRCRHSYYIGSRSEICKTVKLIPAKRKSCPGCSTKDSICDHDIVDSEMSACGDVEFSKDVYGCVEGELKDGKLYRLIAKVVSEVDYYGDVDGYVELTLLEVVEDNIESD